MLLAKYNVKEIICFSRGELQQVLMKRKFNNPKLKFVIGDIRDYDSVEQATRNVDYVFHLAAAVGVFNIVNKPLESLLTNVRGTENLLFFANQFGTPILITSSSEVYGKNASDSLRESDDRILGSPLTLRWSYSEAKAIDESLAFAYFVEKKLETRIVRFFNTVGSRQLGAYGMVLPRFIEAALSNTPITIYGSGTQTRCFAHVSDVVEALIRVAFSSNTIGKVINIGNNVEISMTDLAKRIIERTNSTSELIYVPYKDAYGDGFEDMERRVPNIDLINELVNWSPKLDLDQIIDEIITNSARI
jgi:UDP-glucose 4-epimerase